MSDQQQKTLQQLQLLNELKGCYERLFSTKDGKKVLEDIVRSGGLKRSVFDSDALIMARDAGKQELAQHIEWMSKHQQEPAQKQGKAE